MDEIHPPPEVPPVSTPAPRDTRLRKVPKPVTPFKQVRYNGKSEGVGTCLVDFVELSDNQIIAVFPRLDDLFRTAAEDVRKVAREKHDGQVPSTRNLRDTLILLTSLLFWLESKEPEHALLLHDIYKTIGEKE